MREDCGVNLRCVYAHDRFLGLLKGVTDPEKKREIIGNLFIEIFFGAAGIDEAVPPVTTGMAAVGPPGAPGPPGFDGGIAPGAAVGGGMAPGAAVCGAEPGGPSRRSRPRRPDAGSSCLRARR